MGRKVLIMWYAIWTATGSERKLCSWIKDYIPESLYDDCFVPLVEQNRKVKGEWKTSIKPLFPGYLFIKTGGTNIRKIAQKLKRFEMFAVILSTDGEFTPINKEETYLIDNAHENEGILGSSIGMIEGEKIKILSGPLIGLEGAIRYINRHKRTATIELEMFGRTSKVNIGLEIISKL
jgi:transcriptional antiterminator NusG